MSSSSVPLKEFRACYEISAWNIAWSEPNDTAALFCHRTVHQATWVWEEMVTHSLKCFFVFFIRIITMVSCLVIQNKKRKQ